MLFERLLRQFSRGWEKPRSSFSRHGDGGGRGSNIFQADNKIWLEKAEKKGRYYLNTKKRFKDATGELEGTPSLSPSPERGKKKKKDESSEEETEELKTMKKLRDIALTVFHRCLRY